MSSTTQLATYKIPLRKLQSASNRDYNITLVRHIDIHRTQRYADLTLLEMNQRMNAKQILAEDLASADFISSSENYPVDISDYEDLT